MTSGRPHLPTDLERRVLIEAGHRCAIPTCRHMDTVIHHIIPFHQSQKHEYENLIALCPNCHSRADRGEIDRKSLRFYKYKLRDTYDKYSQFEVDFLFELYSIDDTLWPDWLMLLITRLLDDGLVEQAKTKENGIITQAMQSGSGGVALDDKGNAWIGGLRMNPDPVLITEKGIEFINSLMEERDFLK